MLNEHYNKIKALDALNQELFQLQMGKKEMVSDWGSTFQGTSKSLWLHSWNAFHQIMSPNWSMTTSMADCLNSLKWWWPTSRQALMRRHILNISEWHGRLRRRKWWNHPANHLQPVPASSGWQTSFLYGGSKAVSQLQPSLHRWHTWRRRVLTKRNTLMVMTQMALEA